MCHLKISTITSNLTLALLLQVVTCKNAYDDESSSSAIDSMEVFLKTEGQLLTAMAQYINLNSKKLAVIRGAITEMRAENKKSEKNPEEYLANPINSYALIRRLHEDWISWELYLQKAEGIDAINEMEKLLEVGPSTKDLSEATEVIYRLQDTYDLDPADMANGLLYGKQYDERLTAMDCYGIGIELFSYEHYKHSAMWLNTSIHRYQDRETNAVHDFDQTKIYEAYAEALKKDNRLPEALDAINNALKLNPYKSRLLLKKSVIDFENLTQLDAKFLNKQSDKQWDIIYKEACQNKYTTRPTKLSCHYNKTASAYHTLAPFKVELINLDPYIALYHDVISDVEIASLKELATPHLKRALVLTYPEQKITVDEVRISRSAAFYPNASDVTAHLRRRLEDMTGFDLWDSEQLQVIRYGVGGHFGFHSDFFDFRRLNDVHQGGHFVMPIANVTVSPQKGSALVWYNFDISTGKMDSRTIHASCPVIVGSKWIANQWIKEYSQMFRKPCFA